MLNRVKFLHFSIDFVGTYSKNIYLCIGNQSKYDDTAERNCQRNGERERKVSVRLQGSESLKGWLSREAQGTPALISGTRHNP